MKRPAPLTQRERNLLASAQAAADRQTAIVAEARKAKERRWALLNARKGAR